MPSQPSNRIQRVCQVEGPNEADSRAEKERVEMTKKARMRRVARSRMRYRRVNTVQAGGCQSRVWPERRREEDALDFLYVWRRAPRSAMVELSDHMIHMRKAVREKARGMTKKMMKNPLDSRGIRTVPSE